MMLITYNKYLFKILSVLMPILVNSKIGIIF